MIKADFYQKGNVLSGFRIRGHADFDEAGSDVVCAAASSAVQFAANLITEGFGLPAEIQVRDNDIRLLLPDSSRTDQSVTVLEALKMHLTFLSEDYAGTIQITLSEV